MDLENSHKNAPVDEQMELNELADAVFKAKTNEDLNAERPARRNRKQATEEQLKNPLHGVKLAVILERLVAHYGWDYLADSVNIRCFKYNPTMKSSLGFLRKTTWAREYVEEIYLDMIQEGVDSNGDEEE